MNPIFAAAIELQQFCEESEWESCIIGALAVHRWGEPRLTRDVDLTVLSHFGSEERWIAPLLERFEARRDDAHDFALQTRVVLLYASNGVPLDISLGALPFEERVIERSTVHTFASRVQLKSCSAEDLVVLKAFANRPKDWLDVESICLRQAAKLDIALIWRELDPLVELKEEPEIRSRLKQLFAAS